MPDVDAVMKKILKDLKMEFEAELLVIKRLSHENPVDKLEVRLTDGMTHIDVGIKSETGYHKFTFIVKNEFVKGRE